MLLEIGLFPKKREGKKKKRKEIKVASSLGYPNSYFLFPISISYFRYFSIIIVITVKNNTNIKGVVETSRKYQGELL